MAVRSEQPAPALPTWRYLWGLIRFRPRLYAQDLLGVTSSFAMRTVTGLILRGFLNGLTGAAGFRLGLTPALLLQLAAVIFQVITLYAAYMGYMNFTQHGMGLLMRNMMARILELPAGVALPREKDGAALSTGQVVSTLRDDALEMTEAIIIIDDLVAMLFTAVIAFAIMFSIDVWVTAGTFLPLALILYVAQRLGRVAQRYRESSRAATAQVTGMIADMFHATQAIKVGGAEERIIGRFREVNERRRITMVRDRLITQIVDALGQGSTDIGMGVVLLVAANALLRGDLTVGDFALFAAYLDPATHLMRIIGRLWTRYRQVGVSTQRMEAIMRGLPPGAVVAHQPIYLRRPHPPVPPLPPAAPLQQLEVRGLTYRHEGGGGIEEIAFVLPAGSFTVVTGRIGAGKTTLLQVLLGILPPQAGEIWWNGEQVRDPTAFLAPPQVAYTAQAPRLFSATLRENILLGLPPESVDVEGAIYHAVLEPDLAEMKQGLETMVGPRGVRLSGGQIQRAAAARMFARQPQLLVFDDLSSALDVETERTLWRRLFARAGRPTCLVVSHRRAALRRADQILVLEDGRIAEQGTLAELLPRSPVMQALWEGSWSPDEIEQSG
jgi:ATP-binding cassette, subfamily B, bacterial